MGIELSINHSPTFFDTTADERPIYEGKRNLVDENPTVAKDDNVSRPTTIKYSRTYPSSSAPRQKKQTSVINPNKGDDEAPKERDGKQFKAL